MDEQPVTPASSTPSTPPATPPPTAPVASAPSATPAAATLPSAPDSWPGAFGVYKYSKQAVKLNVGTLIVIWLLLAVISFALDFGLKVFGEIIIELLGGLYASSFVLIFLAGLRGERVSLGQALKQALPFWLKMIGLSILVALSAIASTLLLVIPVFFVLPRLTLAQYFLIDKKMGVMEAYKASWAATKGNVVKVWGIIGVSFLIALLAITIIGIPFAVYFLIMYGAAFAVLYKYLEKAQPVAAATAPSPSPIQGDSAPPAAPITVSPTIPAGPEAPQAPAASVTPAADTPTTPTPPPVGTPVFPTTPPVPPVQPLATPPNLPPSPIQ